MQSQPSSTAPALHPQAPPPTPRVVARRPDPPSGKGKWIVGILIITLVAAGAYLWQRQNAASTDNTAAVRAIRTVAVVSGPLESTIRLTGSTAAENFASLISPRLRGSRSGMGRGRESVASASAPPMLSVTPPASASGNNLSSALKASTSRLSSSAATSSSTSSAAASASAAMGSSGIGSTADSLQGGGGGGGGNDWDTVLQKLVKPGTLVRKGDIIAEFDRQNMQNRLEDYRASVVQTQASLLKLKSTLTITRHAHAQNLAKAKGFLEKARLDVRTIPVLSAIAAERVKLAVEDAEARYNELLKEAKLVEISLASQIRTAEIELQQSNIELRRAEANVDKMIVKAPIDGLTVMSTIPRGGELSQVQEGDQVWPGTLFMSVVDPRSMVVNATVNQADVEHLRLGAKARVRFDAYPGLQLKAHVYSVGGIAKPGGMRATYVKEIPVRLKLDELDPRVIPDLSVSADVIIESEAQAAAIAPLASVFRDSPDAAPYVFVRQASGWLRRQVELGLANHVAVAVRSGLKADEIVAVERPPDTDQKAAGQ